MLRWSLQGNGAAQRAAEQLAVRAKWCRAATREFGERLTREARRRCPRGHSRAGAGLAASLHHRELDEQTTVLASDKVYAQIQNFGGDIVAGKGPLGAKLLPVPLNADARRLLDSLGASTSLRQANLIFVKSRSGRMFLGRPDEGYERRRKPLRGARRQHRMSGAQILFLLVPRVHLSPNPAPRGYAPHMDEPIVREMAGAAIRRHLFRRS